MLSFMKKGDMPVRDADGKSTLHIPMKYIRSAAVSGMMDGEQLGTLNKYITFGFDPSAATQDAFFTANQAVVEENIHSFFKDMAASQLVAIKSSTFKSLNSAMLAIDPSSETTINGYKVSQKILDALQNQITSVNQPNYTARGGMNPEVRQMLGIRTDISKIPYIGPKNDSVYAIITVWLNIRSLKMSRRTINSSDRLLFASSSIL
jgi:hypothetical protein